MEGSAFPSGWLSWVSPWCRPDGVPVGGGGEWSGSVPAAMLELACGVQLPDASEISALNLLSF